MISELPQEVYDLVIDHLWDDKVSLAACSLTCRAWLPSSRTHIFRDIHLKSPSACFRFKNLLETSTIAPLVRKMAVQAYHFLHKHPALRDEDTMWESRIPTLLSLLPGLIELEIACLSWSTLRLTAAKESAFLSRLAHLKHLTLSDVHFETPAQVLSVLLAAPGLETLRFDRVYCNSSLPCVSLESLVCRIPKACTPPPPPSSYAPIFPMSNAGGQALRNLTLRPASPPNFVIDWLLATGEVKLRNLNVHWRDRRNTTALCALLSAAGPYLEHLYMELTNGVAVQVQDEMNFGLLTALRSVCFEGFVLPDCGTCFSAMISQLSSPFLKRVKISLLARWADDLRTLDWKQLDTALSRERFAGVEVTLHVNIAMSRANKGVDARALVELSLPRFQKLGILQVRCT
ncbi:uncharacterized protein FIBRA_03131 [Fibroporia radiculosa]|uniref:F-box domain-containing protein n=1 Tax=Fibroporia radiculosa TaxID=599839 RepID=J4G4A3_9APHY|nr:uncharacterized protein FIBRA_03131 [Fibroporia radiculosa]CCM01083.1 predicted protein [Fibroporia radiculosa]